MDRAITPLQADTDSKMVDVLTILLTKPVTKITDACNTVGVSYDQFRYWQRTHPDFVSEVRMLLGEYQREQLLSLELAWSASLQQLMDKAVDPETGLAMKLELNKYLGVIRDSYMKTYHAEPGVEAEAQAFLSKGPQTTKQASRFASVELSRTESGVRLDIFRDDEKVLEGEILPPAPAPQSTDNHSE